MAYHMQLTDLVHVTCLQRVCTCCSRDFPYTEKFAGTVGLSSLDSPQYLTANITDALTILGTWTCEPQFIVRQNFLHAPNIRLKSYNLIHTIRSLSLFLLVDWRPISTLWPERFAGYYSSI